MKLSKEEFFRMASEVSRYSGKVWASCLTAKNYERDVGALLVESNRLRTVLKEVSDYARKELAHTNTEAVVIDNLIEMTAKGLE